MEIKTKRNAQECVRAGVCVYMPGADYPRFSLTVPGTACAQHLLGRQRDHVLYGPDPNPIEVNGLLSRLCTGHHIYIGILQLQMPLILTHIRLVCGHSCHPAPN